jgi:hypothetical protein
MLPPAACPHPPRGYLSPYIATVSGRKRAKEGKGRAMADRRPGADRDWESFGRAWTDLGLGDLLVVEPGPGVLEIRIAPPQSLAVDEDTIGALLTSLLGQLAGEPVAVARGPRRGGTTDDAVRFLVGSPRLLAHIGAGYEAGGKIAELMEGAWS